jgi:septum formation protein
MQQIILASASPRRESLLKQICLDFQVIPSCVEEVVDPGCVPQETAVQLANLKAHSVSRLYPEAIVLGADTAVCCEGRVLGKPRDIRDAYQMLKFLSGRTHQVVSGVVLCQESRKLIRGEAVTTGVRLPDLGFFM